MTQARIVLKQTSDLMRKWPKSRLYIETTFVMQTAYSLLENAIMANSLYAMLPNEHAIKLQKLEEAYGKLNMLACLAGNWHDNIPGVGAPAAKEALAELKPPGNYAEIVAANKVAQKAAAKKVIDPKKVDTYLGTISHALGVFSGAIKHQREQLRKSLADNPQFCLSVNSSSST